MFPGSPTARHRLLLIGETVARDYLRIDHRYRPPNPLFPSASPCTSPRFDRNVETFSGGIAHTLPPHPFSLQPTTTTPPSCFYSSSSCTRRDVTRFFQAPPQPILLHTSSNFSTRRPTYSLARIWSIASYVRLQRGNKTLLLINKLAMVIPYEEILGGISNARNYCNFTRKNDVSCIKLF